MLPSHPYRPARMRGYSAPLPRIANAWVIPQVHGLPRLGPARPNHSHCATSRDEIVQTVFPHSASRRARVRTHIARPILEKSFVPTELRRLQAVCCARASSQPRPVPLTSARNCWPTPMRRRSIPTVPRTDAGSVPSLVWSESAGARLGSLQRRPASFQGYFCAGGSTACGFRKL